MIIGKDIYYYDQVDSTNTVAKLRALKGASDGTIIIADSQTKGKGRMGKSWDSPAQDGIWMSIILRPNIKPEKAASITLVAGLAICKVIRKTTNLMASIKWPNDIVINGKKLCGILTEMNGTMDKINYLIVGIGINVNTNEFPKELKELGTSLKLESGKEQNKEIITSKFIKCFGQYYNEFLQVGLSRSILSEYKEMCITLKNDVKVVSKKQTFIASPIDIDPQGSLIVRKEDGSYEKIVSGEVSVRGIYGYV